MNILMVLTNGFDPDLRVYKEAKYLVDKGNTVEILCWDRDNRYESKRKEIYDNIHITRFYEKSVYGSGLKQIFSLLRFKNDCKKYIKQNKIKCDIMHCHDLDGMIVGYLLCKKKTKLVFDMHEFYNKDSYAKIYKIVRKVLYFLQNISYKIIYVNEEQTKEVSTKNKDKLVYLPNYPEINKFKQVKHIKSDILRITYAGYVRHFIPLSNLIKASKEMQDILVSIHGNGIAYEKIKNRSNDYNNVKITGEFKHSDIIDFYSNTDIIYCVYDKGNKNNETALPTKFFESIATNIPIMVAKDSLMEKVVKKYDIGFCVDGTDYSDIKNVLKQIKNDKTILNKKIENFKNIKEKFSWEEIVKNLDEIYKEK